MSDLKVYNFMGLRKFALALSILMLVASVVSLSTKGIVFGLISPAARKLKSVMKSLPTSRSYVSSWSLQGLRAQWLCILALRPMC